MSTLENQPTQGGSTPVKKKKRNRSIDIILMLVLFVSSAFFVYTMAQPNVLEVPEVIPETVAPESTLR